MAKDSKRKPSPEATNPISNAFEQMRAMREEENRTKGYDDLLKYAYQYNLGNVKNGDLTSFPNNLEVSPYDMVSPYYGNDAVAQFEAAKTYAAALQGKEDSVIKIDPSFYDVMKAKIPVKEFSGVPHYSVDRNTINLPTPVGWANKKMDLTEEELASGNFGTKKEIAQQLSKSLSNAYRDVTEHEAMHATDKHVSFPYGTQGYWKAINETDSLNLPNVGYMGRPDHLVTGLSKVQREHYAMTGKRFETPEQYKKFILDLATSSDIAEKMSGFSEEAKRTLRSQVNNAIPIAPYLERKKKHEENKSFFKWPFLEQSKGSMLFFEKSAELMPALVSADTKSNTTA